MDEREQWDLKMPPARYLLHHRRATHADAAQRLVKTDVRYDDNQSPEHSGDVASWIARLAPLSATR